MNSIQIQKLTENKIPLVINAISTLNWSISTQEYESYILKQLQMKHPFWLLLAEEEFVGHILLKWQSEYKYFVDKNIPEIANLLVMPKFLRQGYATMLMNQAEQEVKSKNIPIVGLGVGLYQDYGPAQKLYMQRGYQLDSNGITYNAKPILPGNKVTVDDDLLIWLIKRL